MGESRKADIIQESIISFVFILFSIFCVAPLLYILSASFSSENSLALYGYSLIPKEFSTQAYEYIFKTPKQILSSYSVTIFVTVIGTAFSLLFTSMLAYVTARKDFKYFRQLSFMVFFTLLFNAGMVPSYIMITKYYHLKENIWVLILPYTIIPWHVFLMKGFFSDIPTSLRQQK